MKIDIDRLTEAELIDLNHRIVARLRFLQQLGAHATMLEFRIGERVRFEPHGSAPVEGIITRYNRKTVTIVTEDGRRWNVAPEFLQRLASAKPAPASSGNVVLLPPRDKR
ncbi:MAG: hypothetical protein JSR67_08235 [Proteobacteria bacterium]|nr:hypothetical protein [Pseudomonadota bacterium]